MKWKKIYIEITNKCNLACSFCSKSKRQQQQMNKDNFEEVIKKIRPYTNYIFLHVKGEPLIHTELSEILAICDREKIKVNITTNATLIKSQLKTLKSHSSIRQINISLHSENNKDNYLEEIFESTEKLSTNIIIVYRFWTLKNGLFDVKTMHIIDKMNYYYNLSTEILNKIKTEQNIKIRENIYIDKADIFEWPTLKTKEMSPGYCLGGKDQLAILTDGTIVPCCLDGEGNIPLGNIFEVSIEELLRTSRYQKLINGFQCRKPSEELCKKCSFKRRFDIR